MADQLAGKTAVITGGGRGIGRSIAIAYANEGADIALVSRTKEQLDEVAGEIEKTGRKAIAIPTDITDPAQVEAMAGKVNDAFGTIDILINNAGGGIERRSILESEPDEWVKDVTLNLISVYLVTRALLPLLIKAGGGHIINTGSGAGYSAGALRSAYRVGKAGLWMFTRCLAEETWEHGINVNELIPGPVATYLTRRGFKVGGSHPMIPSEYVKGPEDVVPLAVWLATQPKTGPTAQSFSLARRPL